MKRWDCRKKPMTQEEVLLRCDDDMQIKGLVVIDLCDIIDNDLEWLLDTLGERLIGSPCLSNIEYRVVKVTGYGQTFEMEVTGYTDDAIEFFDPDDCRANKDHLRFKFRSGSSKGVCRLCGEE